MEEQGNESLPANEEPLKQVELLQILQMAISGVEKVVTESLEANKVKVCETAKF